MSSRLHRLLLLLLASHCCSAHLTTSVVTVIASSPTSTPCSELDPVTNRMQWAQQCAMAPSNIVPSPNSPAASATCSGVACTTLKTSTRSSKSSPRSGESPRTTSSESSPKPSPSRTDTKVRTIPESTLKSTHAHTSRTSATASTTHPPSSSSTAPSNKQHSSSSTPSIGSIAGLVIGILLALLIGWYLWHTKEQWSPYLPCTCFQDEYSDSDEPYWRDGGRYESSYSCQDPVRRKFLFEPGLSGENDDESPTAPYDVRHLGAGARGVTDYGYGRSYAVTNPDPPSASTVSAQSRAGAVQAYARPPPERNTEKDEDEENGGDVHEDAESQTSDSESVESRTDSALSSADNVSNSSSSYSTDENEEEHEAASQDTASAIIESYMDRRKPRRAHANHLHLTPSSAVFSGAETTEGLPESPSPIGPPPAVYIPYTPRVDSTPYRPGAEFNSARAYWKREPPGRSKPRAREGTFEPRT